MTVQSALFQKYVKYVLAWEGGKSSRAGDTAVRCAPFTGAVHTNKGVTYCTFRELAPSLEISPVTYDRFLKLTDAEVGKFIFEYYKSVDGLQLPDSLSLALTEAAWWSGVNQAVKHLQRALNKLGKGLVLDGVLGPKTLAAVKSVDQKKLYSLYLDEWKGFIDRLSQEPEHAENRTGWFRRLGDFIKRFPYRGTASIFLLTSAIAIMLITKR